MTCSAQTLPYPSRSTESQAANMNSKFSSFGLISAFPVQFTSWMSYLSVSANENTSSLTFDQWEGGIADAEILFRKYFDIIWIATVLTDLKMHDNSQVIAFLSSNVLPSWSLAAVVIKCPSRRCILLYLFCPGGRRGHHWPYQAWPPSADLTVTSHGAREAPSVHVSPRGQTSDIRS